MMHEVVVTFDGGARRTTHSRWIAACASVVTGRGGQVLHREARVLGNTTANAAEFAGALLGLRWAGAKGYRRVALRGDSQLVIGTLTGRYRISHVPPLARIIRELAQVVACESVPTSEPTHRRLCLLDHAAPGEIILTRVEKVRRAANRLADRLCREALEKKNSANET